MKKAKQLGIWMDHSNAFIMELKDNTIIQNVVRSEFNQEEKEISLRKNEKFLQSKKSHFQSSYYKQISNIIKGFQEVLLFGPTDAKLELLNIIQADPLFDKIEIEVKNTDKMKADQMHSFVREHFN